MRIDPRDIGDSALLRIKTAANYCGISDALLEQGIRDGSIPVTIYSIGTKPMRMVNRAEFMAWARGTRGVDLFRSTEAPA